MSSWYNETYRAYSKFLWLHWIEADGNIQHQKEYVFLFGKNNPSTPSSLPETINAPHQSSNVHIFDHLRHAEWWKMEKSGSFAGDGLTMMNGCTILIGHAVQPSQSQLWASASDKVPIIMEVYQIDIYIYIHTLRQLDASRSNLDTQIGIDRDHLLMVC